MMSFLLAWLSFAQKVKRGLYGTASEATGCHTQQSHLDNHSGKLIVASGRFARGTVPGESGLAKFDLCANPRS